MIATYSAIAGFILFDFANKQKQYKLNS